MIQVLIMILTRGGTDNLHVQTDLTTTLTHKMISRVNIAQL